MPVLEVQQLRKTFGAVTAVESISFAVDQGEVFTIIGPNGAGKTTTLEMIEGLQKPDTGDIRLLGKHWGRDTEHLKQIIGVQPQSSALFDLLTVYENMDLFASFYDRTIPLDTILEFVNLGDHRDKRVKVLSGGQKQRLAIGLALVNDPQVIFLDEPTTGLDPQARRNIWDIIRNLKSMGKTTILTTHYMEEAEQLSDRVCIVDQGKIVTIDTPRNLVQSLTKEREVHLTLDTDTRSAAVIRTVAESFDSVSRAELTEGRLIIRTENPDSAMLELFQYTKEQQIRVEQVSIREMSLEDVFIAYTGKEWRD